MRKQLAYLSILLTLASIPTPIFAQEEPDAESLARAKEYYEKGEVAFRLAKFEEAITWFEKAYEETQLPAFLLNIAQSYKQMNRCDRAIFFYKQYRQQDNIDKDGVDKLIQACEEELKVTPPKSEPVGPKTLPSPDLGNPSSISFMVRGMFAAGSVGSQQTGGRNIAGAGLAVGAVYLYDMTQEISFGAQAGVDGRTTGLRAAPAPDNEILQSPDLRLFGTGIFVYEIKPKIEAVLALGLTLDAEGSRLLAAKVGAEILYEFKRDLKLNASLGYETAQSDRDFDQLLGCDEIRCSYQQLDLSVGAWYQIF
jgi:tetratricopeptide (TPR) repeat protein